ncbi:ribonuclease [Rhizobium sp. SSA_523]|uniref:ribonuclease T2 family protein n=1 Tax=Rhizobium sp. SSA_523 TaxID=2952477 RepID=UPI002090010E|nr:ribonuclease [Rhizobium sp. SSA_523]MCO5730736.1 ribonuclease [Rhizobium sp. SSA_523]WKC24440.1 ribonuclease [Rhizobium sp. SSA_523]
MNFRQLGSRLILAAATAASLALFLPAAPAALARDETPGKFDFYVLSLSWSPTFCSGSRGKKSPEQCGLDKRFGFIVHGLWPQNETGYPEFCAAAGPRRIPEALGRRYLDIMPSIGLIAHQWRKHGSCSGLDLEAYLNKTRQAFDRINLPEQLTGIANPSDYSAREIEQSFIGANPGLTASAIAVSCERKRLEEVRICLTKDLTFRDCRDVDRKGCTLNQITVPPAR